MNFLGYRCDEYFRAPGAVSYELHTDTVTPSGHLKAILVVGYIEMIWNANTDIKIYIRVYFLRGDAKSVTRPLFDVAVKEFIEEHGMTGVETYEACLFDVNSCMVTGGE